MNCRSCGAPEREHVGGTCRACGAILSAEPSGAVVI